MSDLVEEAKEAISALYNDMDVDQVVAKERLEELQEHIQDMIDALECDDIGV